MWPKVILINLVFFCCLEFAIYLCKDSIDKIVYGSIPPRAEIQDFNKLIKPSRNSKRYFELTPNLSVQFRGKPFTTNELGFRGTPVSKKKPGTKRILGAGDSVMMGWGVGDSETYLSLLEKKLNAQSGGKFESMNLGTAGYNCSQEYETLVTVGHHLEPDLVVLQYVGNDFESIKSDFGDSPYGSRSYTLSLLSFLFYRLVTSGAVVTSWEPYQTPSSANTESFHDCLKEFGKYAETNKVPFIYVLDSRYVSEHALHSQVEQEAKKLGFTTLNLFALLRKLPETTPLKTAMTIPDEHNRKYVLKLPNDNHPNEKWHELVSDLLLETVTKKMD